jgi:hypothetical protein
MRALVLAASLAGMFGLVLLISAAYAADPAGPYLGMTTEAIVACAGTPHSRYKSGADAETLTYHYSGAGPVPAPAGEKKKDKDKDKDKTKDEAKAEPKDKPSLSFFGGDKKDKKKKDSDWTCTASLTFENGKLTQVNFAHKDVRSPYDWQKEKDPVKQEKLRNAPTPTCTYSLPNCHPAQ